MRIARMSAGKIGNGAVLVLVAVGVGFGFFFGIWENVSTAQEYVDWWESNPQDYTLIRTDTTWSGNVLVDKPVLVIDGATLTLEKGTRVTLAEDVSVIDGTFLAEGTERENIVFTNGPERDVSGVPEVQRGCFLYGRSIRFSERSNGVNAPSLLRYVTVENLGIDVMYDSNLCPYAFLEKKDAGWPDWLLSSAYAEHLTSKKVPALFYESGRVHIENSRFENNAYADIEVQAYFDDEETYRDTLIVVNSNFTGDTNTNALLSTIEYDGEQKTQADFLGRVLLKNNWYGNMNGPSGEKFDEDDLVRGKPVEGDCTVENWRKNDLIADPVIVVPGIMGSSEVLGAWKLDPITHTYDDLVASFETNGYTKEENLFTFPYDWKNHNAVSALLLEGKIDDVKEKTKLSKVDIVAHSMGGLVARAYIDGMENAEYGNDIDQLITLGTPQRGSPKAYFQWEAGEGFFSWEDSLIKHHIEQQAEEAGYNDNLFGYIREKVPSVEELLPDYEYLYDADSKKMRSYPTGYPENTFLEELNGEKSMRALEPIRFINIYGNVDDKISTVTGLRVGNSGNGEKWKDGKPENFGNNDTDQGREYGEGDTTVPLPSAKGIVADETKEVSSTHTDLPTKAQCEVIHVLTNREACQYVDKTQVTNVLLFKVFSPVDMQILAPDGTVLIGKDFETGVTVNNTENKLGFYSGWNGVTSEFVTIPNPKNGKYTVRTQGTGNGSYRVEAVTLSKGISDKVTELTRDLMGMATPGEMEDHSVTIVNGMLKMDVLESATSSSAESVLSTVSHNTKTATQTETAKKSDSDRDDDRRVKRCGKKASAISPVSIFDRRGFGSNFTPSFFDKASSGFVAGGYSSKEESVSSSSVETKAEKGSIFFVGGGVTLFGIGIFGWFFRKRIRLFEKAFFSGRS